MTELGLGTVSGGAGMFASMQRPKNASAAVKPSDTKTACGAAAVLVRNPDV